MTSLNIYDHATQKQIDNFKPTFLYIKRHKVTGLMYFGKTTGNVLKYNGSGLYWKNHITKHGKEHVETLWYCLYIDPISLLNASLCLSNSMDIVKSELFANIKPENGFDGGGHKGLKRKPMSEEQKLKISIIQRGVKKPPREKPMSVDARKNMAEARRGNKNVKGKTWKWSGPSSLLGKTRPRKHCIYCDNMISVTHYNRYHGDNCKSNN